MGSEVDWCLGMGGTSEATLNQGQVVPDSGSGGNSNFKNGIFDCRIGKESNVDCCWICEGPMRPP